MTNFDDAVVRYVSLYDRPPLPTVSSFRLDPTCWSAVPQDWTPLSSGDLRKLAGLQGRSFLTALSHSGSASGLTSHIAAETCLDDPSDDFRPGVPLLEIALDRATSTPGGGRLLAPPVEFGVASSYACYFAIGTQADQAALHATVFVKGFRKAYPIILFTPWADVAETLPALRTVLDAWQWG